MKLLICSLLFTVCAAISSLAQAKPTAIVTTPTQLRELPSKNSDKVKEVLVGTEIKILLEFDGDWARQNQAVVILEARAGAVTTLVNPVRRFT